MDASPIQQICPECGTQMQAGEAVSSCGNRARWWQCPNAACGTSWLIPIPRVETTAILTQITQSSLHGWLNDKSISHPDEHVTMTRG